MPRTPITEEYVGADEDEAPPATMSTQSEPTAAAPAKKKSATGLRRGWSAAQAVADASSDYAQALKLDSNTVIIKFLEDEPYVSYSRHWVERASAKGGTSKRPYTCLTSVGKQCPLCDLLGDRPQSVASFNVALIGDDGVAALKSWDVGVRIYGTIKTFNTDPKHGPITKGYWAVSRTGKGTNSQTNIIPIKSDAALLEDYSVEAPDSDSLSAVGLYDDTVVQISNAKELAEIAAELMADDSYGD